MDADAAEQDGALRGVAAVGRELERVAPARVAEVRDLDLVPSPGRVDQCVARERRLRSADHEAVHAQAADERLAVVVEHAAQTADARGVALAVDAEQDAAASETAADHRAAAGLAGRRARRGVEALTEAADAAHA